MPIKPMSEKRLNRIGEEMLRLMADNEWWFVLDLAREGDYGWWLNLAEGAGAAGGIYVNLVRFEKQGLVERRMVRDHSGERAQYRLTPIFAMHD